MDYGSYLSNIIENPNRKSKHYVRQSKFEGSLRQVRGEILKRLVSSRKIQINELKKDLDQKLFYKALEQLKNENFLIEEKEAIHIKN